jgi:hypothetical protein
LGPPSLKVPSSFSRPRTLSTSRLPARVRLCPHSHLKTARSERQSSSWPRRITFSPQLHSRMIHPELVTKRSRVCSEETGIRAPLQHVAVRLDHAPCGRMNASLEDPGRKLRDAAECGMPKSEADRVNFSATRCKPLYIQQLVLISHNFWTSATGRFIGEILKLGGCALGGEHPAVSARHEEALCGFDSGERVTSVKKSSNRWREGRPFLSEWDT